MENSLVLIVDDDAASRETLADLLFVDEHRVAMAADGHELFEFLEIQTPDVILLDVMMPNINGFEVCKLLKESPRWNHIPVILVTALNDFQFMLTGLESGADEFLTKPVSGPELRARVRNMVRLKRQYDALQETIQLQEDLVRIAVHDMRQPLSTIFLHTSTLLYRIHQEAERKSLDIINIEGRRLDNFIDDLLILIRKDRGNLRLKRSAVNLKHLVQKAIQDNRQIAAAIQAQITFSAPEEEIDLSLDRNLIRRLIDNLLTYAVRQSPIGGTIQVELQRLSSNDPAVPASPTVRLTIADEGSGVLAEHRDKIFDMDGIVELKHQGISTPGLGLAFCKMVVLAHSGTIYLTDNQPTGSVIVIEL